ncbi:DarT1-associated NADAR antitoxin family protein [Roseateles chitinivorans]|uniref:DarT1-associated NADAR antitoxin family protein n=1 Tax=Roseateles chitinivorans TaxID=2917965 RepID=UPI003D66B8E4
MAVRPVFIACASGPVFVRSHSVSFQWHAGMSQTQARKSIISLHEAVERQLGESKPLEISTKSEQELGVALSAFNLRFTTRKYSQEITVESAYQASKVFEQDRGPFTDILRASSYDAKKDVRLKTSGHLTKFQFFGVDWPLSPRTAFYDWLYINALAKNPEQADAVLQFRAFTDIAFNPEKSLNCQARAAALFVALRLRGKFTADLRDRDAFLDLLRRQSGWIQEDNSPLLAENLD